MLRMIAGVESLRKLYRDECAATATEYAVMLALVLAVIVASVTVLGQSLSTKYVTIDSTLFS